MCVFLIVMTGRQHVVCSTQNSLCFNNEVVCVIPVSQQVSGVFIIDAYVMITECAWKEVVYLPGNVEDIAHSGEER